MAKHVQLALSRDPDYTYEFIDEFYNQLVFGTDIASEDTIANVSVSISDFLDNGYLSGNSISLYLPRKRAENS